MLFSSPDYPVFLMAVFFVYAASRGEGPGVGSRIGGRIGLLIRVLQRALGRRWGRIAFMVLLGDVVFVLVAKDPDLVWDPLGNVLLRACAKYPTWPIAELAWHWLVGIAVAGGAIVAGMRGGSYLASERGQRMVARGLVVAVLAVGATVGLSLASGTLDQVSADIAQYAHLLVLAVLGVGIGAAEVGEHRMLGRVVILFVASGLFYQAWAIAMPGPYRYLLALLLGTIVLDYYLALWIERAEDPTVRKALVIVSLCSNLGILFAFKYTDFVAQDVLHLPVHRLNLLLPAGISFHTFQSLSYTIDVYRKQLRATRSPIQFATFVLFFPQLVAGPIVRAQDLLPQLAEPPALDLELATRGLWRIIVGLFKKIALADPLALAIVERVFDAPEHFSSLEVLAGVYGYALQIYLDFSAYSDIAIGSAQVLGFTLPENFRTPYRSGNLQEFWRRWHISLSTWLRDYLYISLGGNRGAPWRTYLNLALTMLLGGLWHGASWTFIVWGALHGLGLAITRLFQRDIEPTSQVAATCVAIAAAGVVALHYLDGAWLSLGIAWLAFTPLWAFATAWLGSEPTPPHGGVDRPLVGVAWADLPWHRRLDRALGVEALRIAMVAAGLGFFAALEWGESATWLPLAALVWGLALAADALEGDLPDLLTIGRRVLAALLVFHYVCLGWIFFRATSFAGALAVLRQLALHQLDHANLVALVTVPLGVGFLCHFFADGGYRWARERFVALPAPAQGLVLAGAYFILRELANPKLVPFIYFQF